MADKTRPGDALRLLVVGSSWPPQTFLGRLLRGLSAAGVRVRIAFTRWPNQEWFHRAGLRTFKTREWSGSRIVRVAWLAWLILRALFVSPRALGIFWRHARSQGSRSATLRTLNRLLPFAGAGRTRLEERLLAPGLRLHALVAPGKIRALLADFDAAPLEAGRGYSVSMLLTLGAWLERHGG